MRLHWMEKLGFWACGISVVWVLWPLLMLAYDNLANIPAPVYLTIFGCVALLLGQQIRHRR